MKSVGIVLTLLLIFVVSSLNAGQNANAKAAIHVGGHGSYTCSKLPEIHGCYDIRSTYPEPDGYFFVVFYDLVCWTAFEYGLAWVAGRASTTSCSPISIGDIVNPGDRIQHGYGCRTDSVCIPLFGYIEECYGPIWFCPPVVVFDCVGGSDTLPVENLFCGGMGGFPGGDPSGMETSTWGSIKALFR